MNWPTRSDYTDAIQNPQANLSDERLRRGRVVASHLGLPRVDSGNFASVFQVREDGSSWAVKCFTRHVKDLQERYVAITEHLRAFPLPCMIDFDYQVRGILVHGEWRPILRMQWVDGPLLDGFVKAHRNDRKALVQLASKWVDCVSALRQANIAHGDLQYGNIKVVESGIKLFDYDGMYVPSLRRRGSSEVGHPNFQHPQRSPKDFDLYIDHFPAWVIYVSLVAIAEHPAIWDDFDGGDDCLIFRKSDFDSPATSSIFRQLEKVASTELRADLTRLRDYAQRPTAQVPSLESVKRGRREHRTPTSAPQRIPDWAAHYVSEQAASPRGPALTELVRSMAGPELNQARMAIAYAACLWIALLYLGGATWLPVTLLVAPAALASAVFMMLIDLHQRFERRAVVAPHEAERRIAAIRTEITDIDRQKKAIRAGLRRAREEVREAGFVLTDFDYSEAQKSALWDQRREDMRRLHTTELEQFDQTEAVRSRPPQSLVNRRDWLTRCLRSLESERTAELATLLRAARQPLIAERLRACSVTAASIPGLGEYGRACLEKAGFHTALDILSGRSLQVFGLGQRERVELLAWAQGLRARAEDDAPCELPPHQLDAVNASRDARKAALESELNVLEGQIADSERRGREEFIEDRLRLLSRFQSALQRHDEERKQWQMEMQRKRQPLVIAQQQARHKRISACMDAAARRNQLEDTRKTLISRSRECVIGVELGKHLTLRLFLESLFARRASKPLPHDGAVPFATRRR